MKISRDAEQSCLISDSDSCTNFPGFEDRTSTSFSIILSNTTGSISKSPATHYWSTTPTPSVVVSFTHSAHECVFCFLSEKGSSPWLYGSRCSWSLNFFFGLWAIRIRLSMPTSGILLRLIFNCWWNLNISYIYIRVDFFTELPYRSIILSRAIPIFYQNISTK